MTTTYTTKTINGNIASACICKGHRGIGTKMVIIACDNRNIQEWLYRYLKPYEEKNYSFYLIENESDFFDYAGKSDTVMAFIEDAFFSDKTIGKLDYFGKQYPKLQMAVFSTSNISLSVAASFIFYSRGGYVSLRDSEAEIKKLVDTVFNKQTAVPSYLKDSFDEYDHIPDKKPYLTHRELEILRYIIKGNIAKKTAAILMLSRSTVQHHVSNIYDKFGVRKMAGVLKLALAMGILSDDSL